MKLSLLFSLILVLIKSLSTTAEVDQRFRQYKKCIEDCSISLWKLLGPHFNQSYYELHNFQFNQIYEKVYPIAIFTPEYSNDVQIAVKCGVKTDIQLVPISGGHSYAGLSIGTNDSILIDFRYMNGILINHNEKVATVQAGTFLGHLYGELWKNGGLGAPLGACATVALGGLVLGGGIGYFSTFYGLVIDNILEMNMVDARGDAVHINKTYNEDLWWAMRGVGPGYMGLLTNVKLKLFKAEDLEQTFVRLRFYNNSFKNVMESYVKWLDWIKKNDPYINTVIVIHSDAYNDRDSPAWAGIEVQILQVKDPNKKNTGNPAFLNRISNIFPPAIDTIITNPSFIEFILETTYTPVVKTKAVPDDVESRLNFYSSLSRDMAMPRYYFAKSFFVKRINCETNWISAEKIVLQMPSNSGIQINSEQGAIRMQRANESSYGHRDVLFNFRVFFSSTNVKDAVPSKNWTNRLLKNLQLLDSGETYQNYPDRELKDYLKRYYGDNLGRLMKIKKKWDPNGYFNSRMSIPID